MSDASALRRPAPWNARVRLLLAAFVVVVLGACRREPERVEVKPEPVLVGPESVGVVEVRRLSTGPRIAGSLEAERQAVIRAETSGAVLELDVEIGDRVERGQVLARLESEALEQAVRSARTGVRAAEQAQAIAAAQLERAERLYRAGGLAEQDVEAQRNATAAARAQLDEARSRLSSALEARSGATVRAPFDGVVSEQLVNEGDIVTTGAHLLTVIDPSSVRLRATVPSEHLPLLEIGTEVRFDVRGYPSRDFVGTIERVAPAASADTRQIPILVEIPNRSSALLVGLYAEGRIAAQSREVLSVPMAAVAGTGEASTVTAIRDGRAVQVTVELGMRDEQAELVEVRSGLARGERVLLGPAREVTPNTPIEVIERPKDVPEPETQTN
ncbi:MAG TPA: efflux RND transporter periplasmic adaptor subunit [Polyangiaceae bacterium]|nr:efflux RND transporter periplasmic adaptor subunit [Polyangiaceae bacterium]